jgi:uncharacterized protein (DUF302 family)
MDGLLFVAGLLFGLVFTGGWLTALMRARMIEVTKSPLSFDETVHSLEGSIRKAGWMLPDSRRLNDSLEKAEVHFPHRVHLIKLCEPNHAAEVLADNRQMACLMPCTIAVYEGDDGAVHVSRMNTRLMGKLFGGSIGRVMGGSVAKAEKAMITNALGK